MNVSGERVRGVIFWQIFLTRGKKIFSAPMILTQCPIWSEKGQKFVPKSKKFKLLSKCCKTAKKSASVADGVEIGLV